MYTVVVTPPVVTDVVVAQALTGNISPPSSKAKLSKFSVSKIQEQNQSLLYRISITSRKILNAVKPLFYSQLICEIFLS